MSDSWKEDNLTERGIGWHFPNNGNGLIDGFNNAASEQFTGIRSLVREVIQNSMDAVDDSSRPVKVDFSLHKASPKDVFPLCDEFKQRLSSCADSPSNKKPALLKAAGEAINSPFISFLKISDFNTTGLTNIRSDDPKDSSFCSLMKGAGLCTKNEEAGGSFGIGKTAPFTCSDLRTVFYYTYNSEGERAFQGKCILASHSWDDGQGKYTTIGTGFFGNCDKTRAIIDDECDFVPSFFKMREDIGTDIFVAGLSEAEDWIDQVNISIMENFFVAIDRKKLVCRILDANGRPLLLFNKETLSKRFSEFEEMLTRSHASDDKKDVARFYHAYREGQVFKADDKIVPEPLLETSELHVLPLIMLPPDLIPKKLQKSKRLFVRDLGMKIWNSNKGYPTPVCAVFIGLGGKLNRYLQLSEPPEHNEWDPNRLKKNCVDISEINEGKERVNAIEGWIGKCINTLTPPPEDEADVMGVGAYLPSEDTSTVQIDTHGSKSGSSKRCGFKIKTSSEIAEDEKKKGFESACLKKKNYRNKTIEPQQITPTMGSPAEKSESGAGRGSIPNPSKQNNGEGGDPNTKPSKDILRPSYDGKGALPNEQNINKKKRTHKKAPIEFRDLRTPALNGREGEYKIFFTPLKSIESGKLSISIVGDMNTDSDKIPILSANIFETGEPLEIDKKHRFIYLKPCRKNEKVILRVVLELKDRLSLSVALMEESDE